MTPGLLQAVEKQVRAAEQQHLRRRRVALGERREVLIDHCLVETGNDLLYRNAGLDECVGVGLGEDAALRADLVQRIAGVAHAGEALRGDLELARGLLDEGAGAPAARGLHVNLLGLAVAAGGEEQRLHVLAANLGDEVDLRMQLLDRGRHGDHLLYEARADVRGDRSAAGAGDEDAVAAGLQATFGTQPHEELEHHLGLLRVVPLVVLPQHLAAGHCRRLYRG